MHGVGLMRGVGLVRSLVIGGCRGLMRAPACCLALALAGLLGGSAARANTLVADLSEHLIAITTAFVGSEVVVFGTADRASDVIVTVQGPREAQVVRRKARVAGIWINRDEVDFRNVPSYYAIASTRPPEQIARPEILDRLELGPTHLELEPIEPVAYDAEEIADFRAALLRNKQRQGLYSEQPAPIRFLGPSLFRTNLRFPANVPPGLYLVQVFELREQQVTAAQRSTLVISKVGLEADLFDFAHTRAALYGLIAITISVAAGWLAGVVFRRG